MNCRSSEGTAGEPIAASTSRAGSRAGVSGPKANRIATGTAAPPPFTMLSLAWAGSAPVNSDAHPLAGSPAWNGSPLSNPSRRTLVAGNAKARPTTTTRPSRIQIQGERRRSAMMSPIAGSNKSQVGRVQPGCLRVWFQ